MTEFFRSLARLDIEQPSVDVVQESFYREDLRQRFAGDLLRWLRATLPACGRTGNRQSDAARMNAANPRYVLRNYLAQQAIDRAEQGDTQMIHDLLEVLRRPYDEQAGRSVQRQAARLGATPGGLFDAFLQFVQLPRFSSHPAAWRVGDLPGLRSMPSDGLPQPPSHPGWGKPWLFSLDRQRLDQQGVAMPFTPDLVDELNTLVRFDLAAPSRESRSTRPPIRQSSRRLGGCMPRGC
jgi:hypothetical protein